MKKWISKWLLALLSTVMVLASLVGCSSSEVNEALDVAIEVMEVVEALEEAAAETADEETLMSTKSSIGQQPEVLPVVETDAEDESTAAAESEAGKAEREDTVSGKGESKEALTEFVIDEDGYYTSKEEVALYIHTYGKLPSNYISKDEAEDLGWKKKDGEAGQLHVVAPGMSIGGSYFGNYEGLLPEKKGRKYYECDINYVKGNRGAERIVYSNDGLIFYTGDHYESFEQLYPQE